MILVSSEHKKIVNEASGEGEGPPASKKLDRQLRYVLLHCGMLLVNKIFVGIFIVSKVSSINY